MGSAARQGFGWALGCLIFGIVLVVVLALLGYLGLSSATPSESIPSRGPTTAPAPPAGTLLPDSTLVVPSSGVVPQGPATLSGTEDHTGPPFTLNGGDYVLTWSATSSRDTSSASSFAAFVIDADGIADSSSVDTEIPGGQKRSGTEYVYGLAAGEHHFKIITNDTSWQVSITPR